MIKYFGALFKEILDDVIGYDSRLRHTIFPLLFQPGKITNDYIRDKRFYYVLPIRLYLITSVLFILLLQFNTDTKPFVSSQNGITQVTEQNDLKQSLPNQKKLTTDLPQAKTADTDSDRQDQLLSNHEVSGGVSESIPQQSLKDKKSDEDEAVKSQDFGIQIEGEEIKFQGAEFEKEGFLKDYANTIQIKWETWKKDPEPLVKQVFELLPYMMFILLPIFAIFLKVFYLFSNRFYIEHLIFLIHNHSFIYVALMLDVGFEFFSENFSQSDHLLVKLFAELCALLSVVLSVWIIAYIYLSMKRVYKQGWGMTLLKGSLLGVCYFTLITIGFISIVLVGAYLA
ncbi:DUF3667 domain-containing protein [Aliikangiella marina]|uniref:DUF3667 domain-containing protein n=1 Tax=Aliikangiella marina TaxID=1712262 RepID=A0A545TC44_9GAMM|nr:DUF3667 domain-containing protein [Aliikangiella marina]TQV74780.1 DUF3667 domain-containing protein [Aliikangiella marina]